jgi:hypothetical protein
MLRAMDNRLSLMEGQSKMRLDVMKDDIVKSLQGLVVSMNAMHDTLIGSIEGERDLGAEKKD